MSARSASFSCVKRLRTRSRRTFAPNTLSRFHSFLEMATTYYIASLIQTLNDTYIVKRAWIFLANDAGNPCYCQKLIAQPGKAQTQNDKLAAGQSVNHVLINE